MSTGDMDRPGDWEQPSGDRGPVIDEQVWSDLVAAFHASPDAPPSAEEQFELSTLTDPPTGPGHVVRSANWPQDTAQDEERTPGSGLADGRSAVTWTTGGADALGRTGRAGAGPRSWPEPADPDEEGFVPEPPPPLPEMTAGAKLAWLAGLGGPLYLMAATLLQWDMPAWASVLAAAGAVGGFLYLVSRLKDHRGGPDDEDPEDPTYGAVV
ncbi:MAG TPA: hypothetical protein VGX23_02370 [Actinocrinis sp.]|nr:hypothetical protein [Actinocrinis sp.]